jgi:hypothetical protein
MAKYYSKNMRKPDPKTLATLPDPARAYIAAFLWDVDPFLPQLRFVRRFPDLPEASKGSDRLVPPWEETCSLLPKSYSDLLETCHEEVKMSVVREHYRDQEPEVRERAFENIMRAALLGISQISRPGSFYIFEQISLDKVRSITLEWRAWTQQLEIGQTLENFWPDGQAAHGMVGKIVCTEDDLKLELVNTYVRDEQRNDRRMDETQLAERKKSIIDAVIEWSTAEPTQILSSTWADAQECTVTWKRRSPDMSRILKIADHEVSRLFPIVTGSHMLAPGLGALTSVNDRGRGRSQVPLSLDI